MADIKPPIEQELAPVTDSAYYIADTYLKIMNNPDGILESKGGGDFKVYAEVLRDDTVKSTFQQRRLAVVSADWDVEPGGDDAASKAAAEALSEDLKALNFDDASDKMLYAVFYGFGVGEIMWGMRDGRVTFDGIKVRDRSRFRFSKDFDLYLRKEDGTYELMPERKFWTVSSGADHGDNPYGLGLAHWLYWPVYFKRTDIKFWLVFLEKFGMPTAVGKLPTGKSEDPNERAKLLAALRSISTETAVLIPEGAEAVLLEAARSGAAGYEAMKSAMDQAIAKIVLSQVMTSEAVGGQYKAEIQGGVRDQVVKADADLLCESFNRGPVKWWTEWNFPGAKPPRVYRKTDPEEDLGARAERDQKIAALGYEPTEEYIRETYGDGWVKKAPVAPPPSRGMFEQPDPNAPDFAEAAKLAALKAAHRGDQTALLGAAQALAGQYESIMGERVQQLLDYAETTEDYETFRKHMMQLLAEPAPTSMAQRIEGANFFARLLGAFRAQR